MVRKVYLASDHAGYPIKEEIKRELIITSATLGIEIEDLGPTSLYPVDYPDYADLVCKKIHGFHLVPSAGEPASPFPSEFGILACGSGQGMAMRANRYSYIRAALCWSLETAKLAREHNDANIICVGSRLMDKDLVLRMVEMFLKTPFEGGRHFNRVLKLSNKPN